MIRISLGLLALALALGAQWALGEGAPVDGAILYVAAVALFLAALGGQRLPPLRVAHVERLDKSLHARDGARGLKPPPEDENRLKPVGGEGRGRLWWAGLGLAAVGVALGILAAPRFMGDAPAAGAWALHAASLLAFVAGALLLDRALRPTQYPIPNNHSPSSNLYIPAALSALVLLAALLRLPRLGTLPFGVWYDEAVNALAALDILTIPGYRPLYLPATYHTAHHNYLVALAFRWLGEGVAQARLVSALMGIALVPAGYVLASEFFYGWGRPRSSEMNLAPRRGAGREASEIHLARQTLTGRTLGLLCAALLAVSAWAVNFSRIGVNYIATPLFALLAVGFTLRALRRGRMVDYLVAGLALGMGLNFYTSFRLFVPVLPIFVVIVLIGGRRAARARETRDGRDVRLETAPAAGGAGDGEPRLEAAATAAGVAGAESIEGGGGVRLETAPAAAGAGDGEPRPVLTGFGSSRRGFKPPHEPPHEPPPQPLQTIWPGLAVMVLAALLAALPLLALAYARPETVLARAKETYICSGRSLGECAPLLAENARTHLLMFNWRGDPNGRHNLPGRPMLDPATGALFVLGLALCLWRWRRATSWLLLLWLGFGLLGGILTLGFESPQSLRANAAIPAAYLIALLPVGELLHAWGRSEGGRYYPRLAPAVALLAFLPPAAWHANAYFNGQARDFASWSAFSAAETITAQTLAGLDPASSEAYVIAYYYDHPTLRWLAPQWAAAARLLDTDAHMPLAWPPGKDVWLFLDPDSRGMFDQLRQLYPGGEFAEHGPPFSENKSLLTAHLTPDVIAATQGLTARFYPNADWSGDPAITRPEPGIDATWQADAGPLPAPFSAEWEGALRVDAYGPHTFVLSSPGPAQLYLDETPVLSGTGTLSVTLTPALGNHALRVRAQVGPEDAGRMALEWQPPGGDLAAVPAGSLYRAPGAANGLLGRYYPNAEWAPPAALEQVDPQLFVNYHVTPLERPYTVEWAGKILIPQAGEYLFSVEAVGEVDLFMDGEPVLAAREPNVTADGRNALDAGLHDIRVRFRDTLDHSRLHLYWTPPGGGRVPLPAEVLFPPLGSYDRVDVAGISARLAGPVAAGAGPGGEVSLLPQAGGGLGQAFPAEATIAQTGLRDPAGVAAGPDGRIYVADTGAARLLILRADGTLERTLSAGSRPFVEPFDVATGPDGSVYLLDAATALIEVFDPGGAFLRAIGPLPDVAGRARGLDVDDRGRVWVAHTPGGRIVALSQAGEVLQEIPAWPGGDAQVTDVAVAPDGSIYAAVLGVNKLVQFDATGARRRVWELRSANTVDSPHLDVDANGNLYLTEPEESRVVLMAPGGERTGYWQLPTPPAMLKPVGVAVDPRGRVWVTDAEGGRVAWVE